LRQINARRAATVESSTAVRSIGVKLLPKPTQIAGAKMLKDRWRRALALCVVLAALTPGAAEARDEEKHAVRRAEMIRVIERYARSTSRSLGRRHIDAPVLEVMERTPRHLFVPPRQREEAYDDRPLPIGYGQTISQPFIVALMTDLLAVEPDDVVLEVGTGSGYQAAVLAPLVRRVCSIEIIPPLGRAAAERLAEGGYANIQTRIGDGYYGWPECGPFDGIVVTAAASHVPPPLIEQLEPGGRMVIPVGGPFATQRLMVVEKQAGGRITTRQLLAVSFVPLTRAAP
jgi:protein-L-isoaspartate(D-aspartate) O-methyltransferase